jgi:hypothetical protein
MVLAISGFGLPVVSSASSPDLTLRFPADAAKALGQIDELVVKVARGRSTPGPSEGNRRLRSDRPDSGRTTN